VIQKIKMKLPNREWPF